MKEILLSIAQVATTDKDHIQQILDLQDDLMSAVKKQQSQIDNWVKQNGEFTALIWKINLLHLVTAKDDKKTEGAAHGNREKKGDNGRK